MTGYRIKTVSALTGVPRNTLLAWERRYRFVAPDRAGNRYRTYSDADVALIREVKALVDRGHAVSEAVALVHARAAVTPSIGPASTTDAVDAAADAMLQALLVFDRERADEILSSLVVLSYHDLLGRVLFPVLVKVGEGWAEGIYTVVQEHFVSAFCRDHVVAIFLHLGCGPAGGPRAVCACMPEEPHELGLLGVSIRLALRGYRVTHLGARVPADQLASFLSEHPPAIVCVSVMLETTKKELTAYAKRLGRVLPGDVPVAFGGRGIPVDLLDDVRYFGDLETFERTLTRA